MAFSVAAIVTLVYAGMAWALNTVVIWRRLPMSAPATWRAVTPRAAGEAPARRAGEMNALLLGSVDENLNYVLR